MEVLVTQWSNGDTIRIEKNNVGVRVKTTPYLAPAGVSSRRKKNIVVKSGEIESILALEQEVASSAFPSIWGYGSFVNRTGWTTGENKIMTGMGNQKMASVAPLYVIMIGRDGNLMAIPGSGNCNAYGQLGLGHTNVVQGIEHIDMTGGWSYVSSTSEFSLGIKNGQLLGWGRDVYGGLGCNTGTQLSPFLIDDSRGWEMTCCRTRTSFAICEGRLFSWGYNQGGQLGLGHTNTISLMTQVGNDSSWDFINVSGDGRYAVGIKAGEIYAWGNNLTKEIIDSTEQRITLPIKIDNEGGWTQAIVSDNGIFFGIKNGALHVRADAFRDSLGLGQTSSDFTPRTFLQIGLSNDWTSITSPGSTTYLGINDGYLYGWGDGSRYRFGIAGSPRYYVPTIIDSNKYMSIYSNSQTFYEWPLIGFRII